MKKNILTLSLLALCLLISSSAGATVPPPPVNQIIGLPDGVFTDVTELGCRACHEDPDIVAPGTIPDRHHLLVGEIIPDPTAAPNGIPGETYECLACHEQQWDSGTSSYVFVNFRDCLLCHQQFAGQASVHHITASAEAQDCKACHVPIDNPLDGHFIPGYEPSMVTPFPGLGTGTNGQGGCKFCHDAGIDFETGILVWQNYDTHHSTGIGQGTIPGSALECSLCHDFQADENLKIRACEQCHGVSSLHNIQIDSDGDGRLDPGAEMPYFGHIGNNEDCLGCHLGSSSPIDRHGNHDNVARHHRLVVTRGMACLDCHSLVRNENGIFEFENFRSCSSCHGGGGRRPDY